MIWVKAQILGTDLFIGTHETLNEWPYFVI